MRSQLWRLALVLLTGWMVTGTAAGAPRKGEPSAPDPIELFDLTVSLEWEPGSADSLPADLAIAGCAGRPGDPAPQERYLDDLRDGMRSFSKYLYQATEGAMALRTVTVSTGGRGWDSADIRILASDSADPMAFIGGRVGAARRFNPGPGHSYMVYPQGMILGRLWNGHEARCGAWSAAAGWRTLGHEWGHHALFLWDEYFNYFTRAEVFCSSTGLSPRDRVGAPPDPMHDSIMAYHYQAGKFWLKDAPPPESCAKTPQFVVSQASDWHSIPREYPRITPPAATAPGPDFEASSAAAAFAFNVVAPPAPRVDSSAKLTLDYPERGADPEGYVIEDRPGGAGPARIIGQGRLRPGAPLAFWMGAPGSRAHIDLHNWATGERRAYPGSFAATAPLDPGGANQIAPPPTVWRPSITVTPVLSSNQIPGASEIKELRVRVTECTRTTQQVIELGYCPAGSPCSALQTVAIGGDNAYAHTFSFPVDGKIAPPATSGYVYARNAATGEEAIGWYQLAGGLGPAHTIGHAPLLDGSVNVSLPAGESLPASADTQVLYGNAQLCAASPPIISGPGLSLIDSPVYVQAVRSDRPAGTAWGAGDPPLAIRLSYDQGLLDWLGIAEERLVVLRLDGNKWNQVADAGRSKALDWIAIEPQPFAGAGAVFALAYGPHLTTLPLITR